jgi:hypothetical protein
VNVNLLDILAFIFVICGLFRITKYAAVKVHKEVKPIASRVDYDKLAEMELEIYGRLMPNVDWPARITWEERNRVELEGRRIDNEFRKAETEKDVPKGIGTILWGIGMGITYPKPIVRPSTNFLNGREGIGDQALSQFDRYWNSVNLARWHAKCDANGRDEIQQSDDRLYR